MVKDDSMFEQIELMPGAYFSAGGVTVLDPLERKKEVRAPDIHRLPRK